MHSSRLIADQVSLLLIVYIAEVETNGEFTELDPMITILRPSFSPDINGASLVVKAFDLRDSHVGVNEN